MKERGTDREMKGGRERGRDGKREGGGEGRGKE